MSRQLDLLTLAEILGRIKAIEANLGIKKKKGTS